MGLWVYSSIVSSQSHQEQVQEQSRTNKTFVKFLDEKIGPQPKTPRLLVLPYACVANMESQLERFGNKLAGLTLIFRQSRNNKKWKGTKNSNGTSVDNQQNMKPICYYFQKPGHCSNQFPDNPHCIRRCNLYRRLGHIEATYCTKKKKT